MELEGPLFGDMGRCALELDEPIDAMEGVEAEAEADVMDMGRRDSGDPGRYSAGTSSTSIESR